MYTLKYVTNLFYKPNSLEHISSTHYLLYLALIYTHAYDTIMAIIIGDLTNKQLFLKADCESILT